METSCAGAASGPAWTGPPRAGEPEFVLLVPDDGRVPVHRGMCFFEIFYFICRHGKPGAVAGYRRHECFS
ncbi:hypothetical protein C0V85_24010 (plasmid) [Salmonella enterica subsp. enterica serovar Hadar]|nr:hypothetical protein C0V85_24010 [Salmonella enterica subsp. enterica serovar Hadar]